MLDHRGKYCIIRTYSAGVHCGIVDDYRVENGLGVVDLKEATRLWNWRKGDKGSLSLSAISIHGAGEESRIDYPVDEITLINCIEIIPCKPKAEKFLRTPRNNT